MKKHLHVILAVLAVLLPTVLNAQKTKDLTIRTKIDKAHVFAFDLRESRSAKGGIWNLKKGKFVTPQNYSEAKTYTIDGKPVVKLYRQVVPGNHPLNGWETWKRKGRRWVRMDEPTDMKREQKE